MSIAHTVHLRKLKGILVILPSDKINQISLFSNFTSSVRNLYGNIKIIFFILPY